MWKLTWSLKHLSPRIYCNSSQLIDFALFKNLRFLFANNVVSTEATKFLLWTDWYIRLKFDAIFLTSLLFRKTFYEFQFFFSIIIHQTDNQEYRNYRYIGTFDIGIANQNYHIIKTTARVMTLVKFLWQIILLKTWNRNNGTDLSFCELPYLFGKVSLMHSENAWKWKEKVSNEASQ